MSGAVGLGAAIAFTEEHLRADATTWAAAQAHEQALLKRATGRLEAIEGLRILGTAPEKAPVLSFLVDGVHPYDLGPVLDRAGVAIRTGHHCTEPLMHRFGVPGHRPGLLRLLQHGDGGGGVRGRPGTWVEVLPVGTEQDVLRQRIGPVRPLLRTAERGVSRQRTGSV